MKTRRPRALPERPVAVDDRLAYGGTLDEVEGGLAYAKSNDRGLGSRTAVSISSARTKSSIRIRPRWRGGSLTGPSEARRSRSASSTIAVSPKGFDQISGRPNGAMSVRAVDAHVPFRAPKRHGVQNLRDLIVVEGGAFVCLPFETVRALMVSQAVPTIGI